MHKSHAYSQHGANMCISSANNDKKNSWCTLEMVYLEITQRLILMDKLMLIFSRYPYLESKFLLLQLSVIFNIDFSGRQNTSNKQTQHSIAETEL